MASPTTIWVIILALIVYVLPSAIASSRNAKATMGIIILNLFLGWCFVGWVAALIWAVTGITSQEHYDMIHNNNRV